MGVILRTFHRASATRAGIHGRHICLAAGGFWEADVKQLRGFTSDERATRCVGPPCSTRGAPTSNPWIPRVYSANGGLFVLAGRMHVAVKTGLFNVN